MERYIQTPTAASIAGAWATSSLVDGLAVFVDIHITDYRGAFGI